MNGPITIEPSTKLRMDQKPLALVADDSSDERWLLREMIEPLGFEVAEACDGRELFWALEAQNRLYRTRRVLVFADVCMPEYGGLEVLEAWRGVEWAYPFVVITGFPDAAIERRVRALGGRLIPKPFSLFDVVRVVERCRA